ncbi:VOC family protein [Glycomyces sp. L485]|uniref:VOC family protein n=1 Tax=Glycomyces sp. L485 TaxID=2909235 RepID=UPI001F4A82BB|nr:VOC family protein [Glycomyces sp. L485]MCH7229594.1 VOC family protein [Glycomyces sp. L485]
MVSLIRQVTFDCENSYALSKFWELVTGFSEHPEYPNNPEDEENLLVNPDGVDLLFINVPEEKSVKNRLHLDLGPDTTRDEEVERLIGIGAALVADHRTDDGKGWVVLADPEGNEFCVERSEAERTEP